MFRQRSDLPLEHDPSSRFLPWLIALMVYLAVLALASALTLGDAIGRWNQELTGALTVQIAPLTGADGGAAESRARRDKALALLRGTPGLVRVEPLDEERIAALLEPWLGPGNVGAELPLPQIIDVEIAADADIDVAALSARLSTAVPGATVDDHGEWLHDLVTLARSIELAAAAAVLLIGLTAVITVVFVTRTGLAVHHQVIEMLHLIGARDSYVAKQFQFHALALGLRGGLLGLALAVITLVAIGLVSREVEAVLMPRLSLSAGQWIVIALVPVTAAAIAMITARVTVLRALAKMP